MIDEGNECKTPQLNQRINVIVVLQDLNQQQMNIMANNM
jgi:hypothetical protein